MVELWEHLLGRRLPVQRMLGPAWEDCVVGPGMRVVWCDVVQHSVRVD